MTAVPGTSCKRQLGTDPDLEKLARQVRRAKGSVEIVGKNHLAWTMPDGTIIRSGLTMSRGSVRQTRREVERYLDALDTYPEEQQ